MDEKYILTLDVGTTTIRSYIYNKKCEIIGRAADQVILHYPQAGYVEIDPNELWEAVTKTVACSIQDANLSWNQISAMGISTQRGTFITWSKKTGIPFHNFITWKDLRADSLVRQWNDSYTWRLIKTGSYALYLLSRSKRYKAGSILKLTNAQTTLRLCWAIQNVKPLTDALATNDAMFGTLDTWLLYKLTGGKVHITDVSSASATGFYDPFTMQWAGWAVTLFKLPLNAFPTVVDTVGPHYTTTDPAIWGKSVPILCCMADQSASMWGSCCFREGDIKVTMGTGTFVDVLSGDLPLASHKGLYPLVGWRTHNELLFITEGANSDTASIIKWAQRLGLYENPEETSSMANSVPDSDGVFFIPAFSGLGAPYNDGNVASGFVGIKPSTTKAHLVRAVLESIAFRTVQLFNCVEGETSYNYSSIRLDGGVSNNDFIAQLVADLTNLRVERPVDVEMSSLGCAHIIGLYLGIWKSKEELTSMRKIGAVFTPRPNIKKAYAPVLSRWEDAVKRLCGWYSSSKPTQSIAPSSQSVAPSSQSVASSSQSISSIFKKNSLKVMFSNGSAK